MADPIQHSGFQISNCVKSNPYRKCTCNDVTFVNGLKKFFESKCYENAEQWLNDMKLFRQNNPHLILSSDLQRQFSNISTLITMQKIASNELKNDGVKLHLF